MAHIIRRMPLSEEVLRDIYFSDQSMYPAPLTYDRLQSWVKVCPELALSYVAPTKDKDATEPPIVIGAAIVLPVQGKYWRDLVVGKIKEIEIDAATMLTIQTGEEVGLHIFHIEKFDSWQQLGEGFDGKLRPFAEYVTADMGEIVLQRGWKVLGFSALTATSAGQKCCTRMNYKPSGYQEIFVQTAKSGGKIEMYCMFPGESGPMLEEGDEVINRSDMMVRFGDPAGAVGVNGSTAG
ncbi:MAG: hypothetical protein M1839_005417 [Geoglossum umbratile]|nr:MAG: hypothetical protein M1839_005417 [Geoglossum umbratile]